MRTVIAFSMVFAATFWSFPVRASDSSTRRPTNAIEAIIGGRVGIRIARESRTCHFDWGLPVQRPVERFLAGTRAAAKTDLQQWLGKFHALDSAGLNEQDRLSLQVMLRNLKERIEGIDLKTYEMPVDQFNGIQLELAQFVAIIPFDSTKHYEEYLSRLRQIPRVIDQNIELLQQGKKDGLMPPKFLLEKAVEQCRTDLGNRGRSQCVWTTCCKVF